MTTARHDEHGRGKRRGARAARGAALVCALGLGMPAPHGHASSPPATPASPALASFDGGQITVADYEAVVAKKAPILREALREPAVRERLLRDLVDYSLLIQEAARRGYGERDAVRVATLIDLTHRVEAEIALSVDPATLPEADARAYYEAHRAALVIAPMRRATYVQAAARAEAQALAARARRMSISEFRDLAASRARDGGGGGELPYVDVEARPAGVPTAAPVDRALVDRAFGLKKLGDVSEPFEHGGAYVVVRVTGITPGAGARFEDAEEQVREALANERRAHAQAALEQRLRAEHAVEVHPELADQVALDPAPTVDIPAGFPPAPPDPRAPTITVEPDDA